MDGANGFEQVVVQDVFREVRLYSSLQRTPDIFIAAIRRQRNQPGSRLLAANGDSRLKACHTGHAEIEQGHIRGVLAEHFHCLLTIGGFSYHGHIRLHIDDGCNADAGDQMILGD